LSGKHVLTRMAAAAVALCLLWLSTGPPAAASSPQQTARPDRCDLVCQSLAPVAYAEAEITGWEFAVLVRVTGGTCRLEHDLRVCRTSLPIYGGDEGTTYGTTLVANPGLQLSAHLARHEKAHRRQWLTGGWSFPVSYGIESLRNGVRCDNRFEQEAGLKDGDYAECVASH
jgi:hypothetical protein